MCGRYALYGPQSRSRLRELFGVDLADWPDRYNIAPDPGSPSRPQPGRVPIIRMGAGGFELALVQWGLLSFWSKARSMKFNPAEHNPERLLALLHANPGVPLASYTVGAAVGNTTNKGPELLKLPA